MKIDRNNYEEFFIDYLDGNLDETQIIMLEEFLRQHPDLREELEGLEKIQILPGEEEFLDKENLKQIDLTGTVDEDNFAFFCIAENEGDLNEKQKEQLRQYLLIHPEKASEKADYAKVYLAANQDVHYPGKKSLQKNVVFLPRRHIYAATAMAAGIALMIGLYFGFIGKNGKDFIVRENPDIVHVQDTIIAKKNSSEKDTLNDGKSKQMPRDEDIRSSRSSFNIRLNIPIASNTEMEKTSISTPDDSLLDADPNVDYNEIMRKVKIDPEIIYRKTRFFASNTAEYNRIEPISSTAYVRPSVNETQPIQYLTLQEYAKLKLSNIVLGEERKANLTIWNVASAGVERINTLAGTDMKLEPSYDEEGSVKALSFNSKLLSFTTPVNQE